MVTSFARRDRTARTAVQVARRERMKPLPESRARGRRAALAVIALCAIPGAVQGCQSPSAPVVPPSGGQVLLLDPGDFQAKVEPVLSRQGCDAAGDCHGGGIRGTYQLTPETAKDPNFDFQQTCLQVWPTNRDQSPILTQGLVGGTPHPYKPFASTADSDYLAIKAWVYAGKLQ
jgi:hypothetical protein